MTNKAANETSASVQGRELIVSRTLGAPRKLVFKAWTDPEHLPHWWGPKGFTITVKEIDVRPGGVWRYVMHGPDGTDYDNEIFYTEVVSPEKLVYAHGGGDDEAFQVTVTFEEQGDKTASPCGRSLSQPLNWKRWSRNTGQSRAQNRRSTVSRNSWRKLRAK